MKDEELTRQEKDELYDEDLRALKRNAQFAEGDVYLLDFEGRIVEYEVTELRLHSQGNGSRSGRSYYVQIGGKTPVHMTEARLQFLLNKYCVAILNEGSNEGHCMEPIDEDATINPNSPDYDAEYAELNPRRDADWRQRRA